MNLSERDRPGAPATLVGYYDGVAFGTLALLWRRRRLILGATATAFLAAWIALTLIPPRYTADVLIQFDFNRDDAGRPGKTAGQVNLDAASLIESEARIVRSLVTARAVVSRLDLASGDAGSDASGAVALASVLAFILPEPVARFVLGPLAPAGPPSAAARRDAVARALLRSLTVTNDSKSYLVTVTFRGTDPARAAEIVNAFAAEYLEGKMAMTVASTRRTGDWYGAQVRESRVSLGRIEASITSFRERTKFVEMGADGGDLNQQQLREVLTQLNVATSARLAEEARLARAKSVLASGNVPSAADLAGAPMIQRLIEAEGAARKEVADLSILLGDKHPNVTRVRASLEEAQNRLRLHVTQAVANLDMDVDAARATEQAISARVAVLQDRLIGSKSQETQLKALQADATATRERLRQLTEGYEQANALGDLKPVLAQVVSLAEASTVPTSPNVPLALALALAGGAIAGAGAAYLSEKRDRGFRTENEFEAEMQASCTGLVPAIASHSSRQDAVIFGEAIRSIVAAVFPSRASPKVVLVTSSVPGEGKSLISMAMARLLVRMGKRVLVIDGSPRRLLIGDGSGPSETLDRVMSQTDPSTGEEWDRMSVVRRTSGLSDGPSVFSSEPFEAMLREARERYDIVLFEVPPVMLLADIVLLRDQADSIIHVVRWNDTLKSAVATTLQQLARLKLEVSAVVLNRVDLAEQRTFNYVDRGSFYRKYSKFYSESA